MPIITIRSIKGSLNDEKKKLIFQEITDVMVKHEGNGNEAFRPYVIINLDEQEPTNFGMGGKQASSEFFKKII